MSPSAVSAHPVPPDVIPAPRVGARGHRQRSGDDHVSSSIATGDVLAVDLTGDSHLAVDAPPGRTASGLEQDRWGRLWVAGGPAGRAYVYLVD